ncbi:MAG: TonB-dependent receptor [Cyclobacteriaceae bacterium]|nr:TonB-dependent receptor [Cyclobacteriaceae bacterium]
MLKSIYVTLVLALPGILQAQTIRGRIVDGRTQTPLAGATVQLKSPPRYAVTDQLGFFTLPSLPAGEYEAEVRFVGYQTLITPLVTDEANRVIQLQEAVQLTDQVIVSATRAVESGPTVASTIQKAALQKQNYGQDLPFVLNWTPSLVSTSDAGAGVGYTGLRIRGSDATRINVTINGIPVNDSESQGVFWVNTPDLTSSLQSVQVQRGVGTSTNGAGAFGASVNLQTTTRNDAAYADVVNSVGSFNTLRNTVAVGTGLLNNKFVVDGRLSRISSDGYIDRASSDLKSYYLSGAYYANKTILKAIAFGGKEITYQSWYGVPESRLKNDADAMLETAASEGWNQVQTDNLLRAGRTFNLYTYANQVDNYQQDHYQFHVSHRAGNKITLQGALHYTKGKGFYEEFRTDNDFEDYGLPEVVLGGQTISSTDLIRRRWLDNDFYGVTYSINYDAERFNSVLGGAWNNYVGDHFGQIIWAQVSDVPKDYQYYFNRGTKKDFTIYWKNSVAFTEQLAGFVDLQYRNIDYQASGKENKQFDFAVGKRFNFFNPKLGLTYTVNSQNQFYSSYAVGNREPVRDDFIDAMAGTTPRHEHLGDLEAGWRFRRTNFNLTVNYYYMDYKNQLVPTGRVNDVGALIRTNVARSFRSGVEVEGLWKVGRTLSWMANLTLSKNKITTFNEIIYDYGENFDEYNEVTITHRATDIAFSPAVIAGSALQFTPKPGWEVSLLTKYVGRQFLDNTTNNNRRIDAYFINDLRVGYTWHPKGVREVSLSGLLNNVLDVQYVSNGYTWGYLGGLTEYRQNYYYPQAGRNYMLMLALRL